MTTAARFGYTNNFRASNPLSNDQIARIAPSVFAAEAHESRSSRYTYIPTVNVLDGLRREGFEPFSVVQSRSRIPGKVDFTKHLIRLRRVECMTALEAPEIILINSHDGTSSYQLMSGMIRFACINGLITGDIYDDVRIHHKGDIVHNVIEGAYSIADQFRALVGDVDDYKAISLNAEEQQVFAQAALTLKYDEDDTPPIKSHQLLNVRRVDDKNNDLWTTFNRVQENIIRGGLRGRNENAQRVTTREVKGIDSNVKLNKALWTLTSEMAKLKK